VGHLSTKEGQSESIEWRRSKVLELASEGYSQREIAQKLQIGKSAVNRDVLFLRKQARDNLQYHIHDKIPEEYQSCMTGMKLNLKEILEIAQTTSDPKTKLQARAIANDCYRYIMDLCTNAGIVSDALKFVERKKEQLNTLQKIDERIEDMEEDKTTNGVF
jgi:transposase